MTSAKTRMKCESENRFPWDKLTWDDLSEWTDSRSLERGRSYQRSGAVGNLSLLPDGGILADVMGTQKYFTVVTIGGKGRRKIDKLESTCSCPVGVKCKHGVAVLLEYLNLLEKDEEPARTGDDDPRILVIEEGWRGDADIDEETNWAEDDRDEAGTPGQSKKQHHKSSMRRKSSAKTTKADIRQFLKKKSKQQLIVIIEEACKSNRKLKKSLADRVKVEAGDFAVAIRDAKKELVSVTSEDAWYSPWDNIGHLPDYSSLNSKFEMLIEHHQFDAVTELGRELIICGIKQVENSDDDGETAYRIADCISAIAPAIKRSSMTDVKKILFVIDAYLQDDYDLCDGLGSILEESYSTEVWAGVADQLGQRLGDSFAHFDADDFGDSYSRERLGHWVVSALDNSGQSDAATDFCVSEAERAGTYQRAVDRLIAKKRFDDAMELAERGLKNTKPEYAGLIGRLQDSIAEIALTKDDNHLVGVAVLAQRFVDVPSVESLESLLQAARKSKCERPVREVAMAFLKTGIEPHFEGKSKKDSCKKSSSGKSPQRGPDKRKGSVASKSEKRKSTPSTWPFPAPPGGSKCRRRIDRSQIISKPNFVILIQWAIKQKDAESVLHWYDAFVSSTADQNLCRLHQLEKKVAAAIAHDYAERAIELYCAEADCITAQSKSKSYPEAIAMLREVKKILKREKRAHEFEVILETFRKTHRRKRRLIDLLDDLNGKPIVSKKSRR